MTGSKEENPESKKPESRKLVLGGSRLSLNKSVETTNVTPRVAGSRSSTVVEVKKSKLTLNAWQSKPQTTEEGGNEEFNKRLSLLKKAAEGSQSHKTDPKFSTLSKIVAANRLTP